MGDHDFVHDEQFIRLYQQAVTGKINIAITRLPINIITSGFYVRRNNTAVRVANLHLKLKDILSMELRIRGGWRPTLLVYWSPLVPGGGGYVCPDDEVSLAAYANLNVGLVPCKVLKPKKVDALEASFWLEERDKHTALARSVPPTIDKYVSFSGDTLADLTDLFHVLIQNCEETRAAIIAFHEDYGSDVHYHQMLHAFLRRHERLLDSIGQMVELGRTEHAEALTRVGYEAFLNFYLDWLAPEFFGPRLQLLAAIRDAQSRGIHTLDDNLLVLANFVEFLENVGGKARVSPLGSLFHDLLYPPLSLVAHQSYIYLENEASEFGDPPNDPPSRAAQLGRWLDVLTAALVLRVRNDIGIGEEFGSVGQE